MNYKQFYSFDLWNTLFRSNPEFKKQRLDILTELFETNDSDENIQKCYQVYIASDSAIEKIADATGKHFGFEERLRMMSYCYRQLSEQEISTCKQKIELAFLTNPPILINPHTEHIIQSLRYNGCGIAVCSNTGMIDGSVMRRVLEYHKLMPLIDVSIFSNEVGFAKPHKTIFNCLKAFCVNAEIFHVGDNLLTDYLGAINNNIQSFIFYDKEVPCDPQIEFITSLPQLLFQEKKNVSRTFHVGV